MEVLTPRARACVCVCVCVCECVCECVSRVCVVCEIHAHTFIHHQSPPINTGITSTLRVQQEDGPPPNASHYLSPLPPLPPTIQHRLLPQR